MNNKISIITICLMLAVPNMVMANNAIEKDSFAAERNNTNNWERIKGHGYKDSTSIGNVDNCQNYIVASATIKELVSCPTGLNNSYKENINKSYQTANVNFTGLDEALNENFYAVDVDSETNLNQCRYIGKEKYNIPSKNGYIDTVSRNITPFWASKGSRTLHQRIDKSRTNVQNCYSSCTRIEEFLQKDETYDITGIQCPAGTTGTYKKTMQRVMTSTDSRVNFGNGLVKSAARNELNRVYNPINDNYYISNCSAYTEKEIEISNTQSKDCVEIPPETKVVTACASKGGSVNLAAGSGNAKYQYFFLKTDQTAGKVVLQYETYGVPDQVRVYRNNKKGEVLLDTGCIGTRGWKNKLFEIDENITGLLVEVNADDSDGVCKNNKGNRGTAWRLNAVCRN